MALFRSEGERIEPDAIQAVGSTGQVLTIDSDGHVKFKDATGGMTNPMTTAGDLIVGGVSGAPGRLAKGSDTQILQMVAGAVAWGAAPSSAPKEFWIPATAMWPSSTNASGTDAPVVFEATTNKQNIQGADAQDLTGKHYFEFCWGARADYLGGNFKYQVYWRAPGTSTNSAVFGLQAIAYNDASTIDASWGSAVEVTDAHTATANQILIAGLSGNVTAAGSPAAGSLIQFRLYRDPDNGSDTLAQTVSIVGVRVFFDT